MKIKEIILGSALVASTLTFTQTASASENLLCNDCTTVQMRHAAIAAGSGTKHVVDLRNGVAKKYEVLIENEFGFQMKTAAPLQPDAYIVSNAVAASEALQQVESQSDVDILIPEYIAPSAYHLSGNSRLQNNTIDWLNDNLPFEQSVMAYTFHAINIFPAIAPINVELTITFSDGSEMDLRVRHETANITGDHSFLFEVAGAKDSDNNSVPLTADQFAGISEFNGGESNSNVAGFQRAASNHGIVVRIPPGISSGSGSGWVATIVCSKTNGETTCTKRYVRTQ